MPGLFYYSYRKNNFYNGTFYSFHKIAIIISKKHKNNSILLK